MKCTVFIATSVDGFIAKSDGNIDWLDHAGKQDITPEDDMGFSELMNSIDCMIMGRNTMEVLAGFELTDEQWPYGNTPIFVLSTTQTQPPESLKNKVSMINLSIDALIDDLESKGFKHAYVDGGATIRSFLHAKQIDEMVITLAPILLGNGIRLFGDVMNTNSQDIRLENTSAKAYGNDFIQTKYDVVYE